MIALLLVAIAAKPAQQIELQMLPGQTVVAKLFPKDKRPVQVFRHGEHVFDGIRAEWQPWRLARADVDGDGRDDLIVAVHKPTRRLPFEHNTLFLYHWKGARILPKWQGSTMGVDFTDFAVLPPDARGRTDVVLLERHLDRSQRIGRYSRAGFGFRKVFESQPMVATQILGTEPDLVILRQGDAQLTIELN